MNTVRSFVRNVNQEKALAVRHEVEVGGVLPDFHFVHEV